MNDSTLEEQNGNIVNPKKMRHSESLLRPDTFSYNEVSNYSQYDKKVDFRMSEDKSDKKEMILDRIKGINLSNAPSTPHTSSKIPHIIYLDIDMNI